MKKITIQKFLKILPILVILLLLLAPTDAYAFTPLDWIKESLGKVAHVINDAGKAVKGAISTVSSLINPDKGDCPVPVTGESSNCLFCPMFEILFNASAAVAAASYRAFKSDLGQVLLCFLAVVIALNILKNLASMGARDAGTVLNDLVSRTFVCAAIYVIITRDYYNMMNMTILPILQDGMSFIGLNGGTCRINSELSGFIKRIGAGVLGGDYGETIPNKIGTLIITAICNIEQKIHVLFDYGEWAWCLGTGPQRILLVLPNPIYLIDGALLYLGGVFFMVAYPWVLADAVLQLGISLALLPFAVVGYAFGNTKKYLPKLFSWILHSLFVFIFMSILLTCILGYIAKLLGLIFNNIGDYAVFFTNPNSGLAFYGPNMVKVLFILIIGWTYMPMVRNLAENFAQGSGLSAAQTTGDAFVIKPTEHYTEKAANYAAEAAGNAALSAAGTTGRLTRGANRNIALALTKTFGSTDAATGNKTFKFIGGTFTAEKNVDGKTILKKERTTFNGRKHTSIHDKYSTIHLVQDSDGNLISSQVEFKHNFAKKYLFNANGEINVGAMKKLLDESRLSKDPVYRQAIMEQLAVEAAKQKGYRIGSYFNRRNVSYDPANPYNISIRQVDHKGSMTSFSLAVNEQTGQTAIGYSQDVTETSPLHTLERKSKLKMHKLFMGQNGHYTAAGNLAFKTWFGTEYEMRRDAATGEEYYIRGRKKYWLFGPYEIKEFHADGTIRHLQRSARAQAKSASKATKIATKLNGATTRKTLFHTYGSYVDANGNTVYTKNLRSGWNIKNYFRTTSGVIPFATRTILKTVPQDVVKVTTSLITTAAGVALSPLTATLFTIGHPQQAWRNITQPKRFWGDLWRNSAKSFKNKKDSIVNEHKEDWNKSFGSTLQTGDVKNYTSAGEFTQDSLTGQTASVRLNNYTVLTDVNGQKVVRDNTTGNVQDASKQKKHRKEFYFSNGVLELRTSGEVDNKGNIVKEKTKFKYSKAAQYGHDSIISEDDTYQVVNRSGVISDRLQPTLGSGDPNPLNLIYGLDNIAGVTIIGGRASADFVVNNILKEGRIRKTNQMETNFLNVLNSRRVGNSNEAEDDDPDLDDDEIEEEEEEEEENNPDDGGNPGDGGNPSDEGDE